jgi:hypothetical protein
MKLATSKLYEGFEVEVFAEDNSDSFYMCRSQINTALDYKDDKSLARIISTHRDVIGKGKLVSITKTEGDRVVTRELEMFSFEQIFQMLRFSKSDKANTFMEFTAATMKYLLSGKAELDFKNPADKEEYLKQVKSLLAEYKLLGIAKSAAAVIIQEAKLTGSDPNVIILDELKRRKELDSDKARGRIRERVEYYAQCFLEEDYEEAWHLLARNLKFEIGKNLKAARDRMKKAKEKAKLNGVKPLPEVKSYLVLIEELNAFKETEKVLRKMCSDKIKENKKKEESVQEAN